MGRIVKYGGRARTNHRIVRALTGYLSRRDVRGGIIISTMFVEIRLRTLVAYAVNPSHVSRAMFKMMLKKDRWSLGDLIDLASKLKTITATQRDKLFRLLRWRNLIAHELTYWTESIDKDTQKKLRIACYDAIDFMIETVGQVS